MKNNLQKNIEKNYKIKYLFEYTDKNNNEFIKCKDIYDNEEFIVKVLPGENLDTTFRRVFGFR